MAAIVATLVSSFTRFFDFLRLLWGLLATFFEAIWLASMTVMGATLGAFFSVFTFIASFVVKTALLLFTLALNILPQMPPPTTGEVSFNALAQANRYIPIAEVVAMSGVWAVVFGAIGAYKLAKFIRGAG